MPASRWTAATARPSPASSPWATSSAGPPSAPAPPPRGPPPPHVAAVGLAEERGREGGGSVNTQRFSFRGNAMALIHDETDGFVKLVSDADSGDVLGVHILGHQGGEMLAGGAPG